MTNKNKKSRKNASSTAATKKKVGFDLPPDQGKKSNNDTKSPPTPRIGSPSGSNNPTGLSRGQLAVLILLSLGIARLIQVGSAAHHAAASATDEEGSSTTSTTTNVCVTHLGSEACKEVSIQALLKYKYFTGIQTLMVVAAAVVPSWSNEVTLGTLGAFFVVCLGMFGTTLLLSPGLLDGITSNVIMSLVLTAVALPSSRELSRRRLSRPKTLQSLCLLTMAMQSAYRTAHVLLQQHYYYNQYHELINSGNNETATAAASNVDEGMYQTILLRHPPSDTTFWKQHKLAIDAIVNFVGFDFFVTTLMLLFAWYFLPNANQRSFLLSMTFLQLGEYWYSVPPEVAHEVRMTTSNDDDPQQRTMWLLLGAFWCGLSWLAPDLEWKKRL